MKGKPKQSKKSSSESSMGRRRFMGTLAAAAGTSAVAGTLSPFAPSANAETVHFKDQSGFGGSPFRCESDIRDCDIEGEIPLNINGAFYRVGPDWQYPAPRGIPFDGEGHVSMFRIENGHVDFRS